MQKKLAACFLALAFVYLGVGVVVPRLEPDPLWATVLVVSIDVMLGLGAAWILSARLTRRLRELALATNSISQGDLCRRIEAAGDDEAADLARSLSAMVEGLLGVIAEVRRTAVQVHDSARALSQTSVAMNAATEEIAQAAQAIARGAEQQVEQVQATYTATRQLADAVERIAHGAHTLHDAVRGAAERAGEGTAEAHRAEEGIARLSVTLAETAGAVDGFRSQAEEIAAIVGSISSLSHETHLLAINASIEAARAGEEGRGFAIVAEEVRHLAARVMGFTERISSITSEIVQGSRAAASQMRQSVEGASAVCASVESTSASFAEIRERIRETAAQIGEISGAAARQGEATAAVASSLEMILQIARANARGTDEASTATEHQTRSMHELASSAQALTQSADQLRGAISIFRVDRE